MSPRLTPSHRSGIVVTARYRPVYCHRCGVEVATLIMAATPDNPRRRLIKVNTATITDSVGNEYCPDCWPIAAEEIAQAEALLVLSAASRVYTIDPTYRPAEVDEEEPQPKRTAERKPASELADLTTPGRMRPAERFIVRHNGRVVDEGRNGKNGGGKA
jgi:hypothetical protein